MINDDAQRFPARKNPRMRQYDYSTPNYYFITICTHNKCRIFGTPEKLNSFGRLVERGILEISSHFPNATVDKFVVMPNHVHLILVLRDSNSNLSAIVGQLKSYVTRQIHLIAPDQEVWQASFHDHVIRNQKSYEKIWQYIDSNPIKWEDDCFYSG